MRPFCVLILGGVQEAYALAERLADDRPDWRVITSLAGRTRDPRPPRGEWRVGGYGGPNLLAAFIEAQGVDVVVDATHPFAARIAAGAASASGVVDCPRIKLLRPPYAKGPNDEWRRVDTIGAAAATPPSGARVFLALGAGGATAFLERTDLTIASRTIDPPAARNRVRNWRHIVGRPSEDVFEEASLLRSFGAEWLIARDSGGAARAKLDAARLLRLRVLLVDRPAPPAGPIVETVDDATDWLDGQALASRRRSSHIRDPLLMEAARA